MERKFLGEMKQDTYSQKEFVDRLSALDLDAIWKLDINVSKEGLIKFSTCTKKIIKEGDELSKEELILLLQNFDIYRGKYFIKKLDNGKFTFYRVRQTWIQKN